LLDNENTNGEGWNFYCTGQILHASVLNDEITGIVRDMLNDFQVRVKFREHELECICTCESRNVVCKHVIALLYSWINDREEFTNIGQFVSDLKDLDKDHLIEILKKLLIDNPENLKFFIQSFESGQNDDVMDDLHKRGLNN